MVAACRCAAPSTPPGSTSRRATRPTGAGCTSRATGRPPTPRGAAGAGGRRRGRRPRVAGARVGRAAVSEVARPRRAARRRLPTD
jgi:hypothetical protein